MRKATAMLAKRRNEITKGGFHLDDVEQWDDVLAIPDEIGDKIVSYFKQNWTKDQVMSLVKPDQHWMIEFIAMYHESYA